MSVVIEAVDEIQVFINEPGSVTILQKDWANEDSYICFPIEKIDVIIKALSDLKSS